MSDGSVTKVKKWLTSKINYANITFAARKAVRNQKKISKK